MRHRGPPPRRIEPILRAKGLNAEAAVLAGLCLAIGVLPSKQLSNSKRELPSLTTGERLCYAFELYRQMVPQPRITLDQLVLLVMTLAERIEVALSHCDSCDGAILAMLLQKPMRTCTRCAGKDHEASPEHTARRKPQQDSADPDAGDPLEGFQRSLF
jgi:hypothetical protein